MNYKEFRDGMEMRVRTLCLQNGIYENPDVKIEKVVKNNGMELYGLQINEAGDKGSMSEASPIVYLEEFYDMYKKGTLIGDVAKACLSKHEKAREKGAAIAEDFLSTLNNKEAFLSRVMPELRSISMNPSWIETMPHRVFGDIMEIAVVATELNEGEFMAAKINNSVIEAFEIGPDELFDHALENMKRDDPAFVQDVFDKLSHVKPSKELPDLSYPTAMAVLTCEKCGAAAALDEDMIGRMSEKYGDVYLIPSSIYEFLVLPKAVNQQSLQEIREMVYEINRAEVSPEDRLSDQVYEIRDGKLSIAMTAEERAFMESVELADVQEKAKSAGRTNRPKKHSR